MAIEDGCFLDGGNPLENGVVEKWKTPDDRLVAGRCNHVINPQSRLAARAVANVQLNIAALYFHSVDDAP